ncbi:MAG: ATP-dependent DNA ligase [Myxococcales bacterium]
MALPVEPPLAPVLARLQGDIPSGEGWLYEPKWDGFRAIVFREGERVQLVSRNGQPLERYFPELIEALREAAPARCVIDGEIVIETSAGLDFGALLQRIHPAASRVRKLSSETPASFVAFDLLALGEASLLERPFSERRRLLESALKGGPRVYVTAQTSDPEIARRWYEQFEGAGIEGVVAKRAGQVYVPGERVMVKVKHERTADCVIGGYRSASKGGGVGSILLGLYDAQGELVYVGFASAFSAAQRRELLDRLRPLEGEAGFAEGKGPGGPSRWNRGRDLGFVSVAPRLVCEVRFDKLQGARFRHAAQFKRWRPDKDPRDCTFDQIAPPRGGGRALPLARPRADASRGLEESDAKPR